MTSQLFTPFALRGLTLPNRIVIPPMCQYSATDGIVGDWHLMHWGMLSHSGAGLLIQEATAVTPEGRITPGCAGLWSDAQADAWARVMESVRRYSAMPMAVQLAHAGRKAATAMPWRGGAQLPVSHGGWPTVAPSALPFSPTDALPTPLDDSGMARIRQAFAAAARRADRIGMDALELHAAHGYLLHEFLSPLSNQRTDAYGGSLENRLRFPLEVFQAVREVWPSNKPLWVRVSATDWMEGGWDVEQTVVLGLALKERGCDALHVSTGGLDERQQIAVIAPGFQVAFAQRLREATGLPTMAVGLITQPQQAEDIVVQGQADLVAVGRGILNDPRWPWHAAQALGAKIKAPPQLWRAVPPKQDMFEK